MSLLSKDKSLKHYGLQLLDQHHLNHSSSSLNYSFNSNKILPHSDSRKKHSLPSQNSFSIKESQKQPHHSIPHKQSFKDDQSSLIKSKQILQKFNHKLSSISLKRPDHSPIQFVKAQICQTTNQINKQIDKKIQNTFSKLLNTNTVMPIPQTIDQNQQRDDEEKQNFVPNALSYIEGTKMLMTQYWEKQIRKNVQTPKLLRNQDPITSNQPSSNLPKINQRAYSTLAKNQKIILGKVFKHQKKRQQLLKTKDQQLKMEFLTFSVNVVDFKIQNQSKQFLLFQRVNFKKWEDILFVLQCLEKFCQIYQIKHVQINLKKVLELVEVGSKRQKLKQAFNLHQQPRTFFKEIQNSPQNFLTIKQFTTHELLNCFEDPQKISQTHPHSRGIIFFGNKGKKRAIVKIQAHFRRFLCKKKFEQLKKVLSKVILIQRNFRSYMEYCKTKRIITENQMKKIERFKAIQNELRQNYRKNEITKKIKYEIHICSLSASEWQRVTTQNLNERQNTELSRIFRIATKSTPLIETRVIYVAPNELSKEIVNYYKKIFEFGSDGDGKIVDGIDKLNIIWPQDVQKLPENLTLTQKLIYSRNSIKKLKRIIKGQYCYIVPSCPSNDFITLSCELGVPLYSAEPQKLLYLQTQAGSKQFAQVLKQSKDDTFGLLPYTKNIYNKTSFVNELTFLVHNYPTVRRWVLKIDHQNHSRGLAYIDTSKIIKNQLLTKAATSPKDKALKQQIYQKLYESLITFKEERIIPVSKEVYHNQEEYLNHFLSYGGIIEASINNFESDLENHCFVIQIEPDFEWKFVTSYYKITNKNKTVGCYFDSTNEIQPPLQIQILVNSLIKKKLFGFFTLEFLQISNKKHPNSSSTTTGQQLPHQNLTYFNGIQCHLNEFSSASFLKEFLSKDTNVLYIPFLQHPSLKELRIQTFFHLCRLENISFDIKRKIGNVFMFLNGLESGCMGLMSFNGMSKKETFQQVSDVLQFMGSKISQSKIQLKSMSRGFMSARNVVNGYLKREREERVSKLVESQSMSAKFFQRPLSNKESI